MSDPAVRWLTIFIDRPRATFDTTVSFWEAVTDSTRPAGRGEHDEFATLEPADGDAHVRVQRVVDGPGGTHLDIHTDDVDGLVANAVDAGAKLATTDSVHVLCSPGGYPFCAVGWHGEATPSTPHVGASGAPSRLDQVCLDIAPGAFDDEVRFWSVFLGTPIARSTTRPEFAMATEPDAKPIRILLQRLDNGAGPTIGHLDVAAGDRIDEVVADHVAEGAEVVDPGHPWTVIRDPSGHRYCVTPRDPSSGMGRPLS